MGESNFEKAVAVPETTPSGTFGSEKIVGLFTTSFVGY
jgi:hypothetical protein